MSVESLSLDCRQRDCVITPDIGLFSLEDRLAFNGTPLSFIEQCPTGYFCPVGSFPRVFTYPPGRFVIPLPPTGTGFPIIVRYQGCSSLLQIVLPPGATPADVGHAANSVIAQAAAQQAKCDAINTAGPLLPVSIHLSDIADGYCVGALVALQIQGTSTPLRLPITFTVTNPPAFLTHVQNASTLFLSGIPSAIGVYNFSVQATAPGTPPGSGSKSYTLNVVGIATASPLPDGEFNVPYSLGLTAPSITGTLTWSLVSGTFPNWMSLNPATGILSGTPGRTSVGDIDTFTIGVTNGTIACTKEFDIETGGGACADIWLAMDPWAAPSLGGIGAANSATSSEAVCTFSSIAGSGQSGSITMSSGFAAFVFPPALICGVTSIFSQLGGTFASVHIQVIRASDSVRVLNKTYTQADGPGTYNDVVNFGVLTDSFSINVQVVTGTLVPGQDGQAVGTILFGV